MIPGDIIYIEAQTGNGDNGKKASHEIAGHYEFVKEDETYIWIKDEHVFRIRKDKITKIV